MRWTDAWLDARDLGADGARRDARRHLRLALGGLGVGLAFLGVAAWLAASGMAAGAVPWLGYAFLGAALLEWVIALDHRQTYRRLRQ